ncbi:lysine--tRNA ligase [Flavobacteriales bacterium]|jgi:lysyl-tRNA synthetase, class II|nr:lysine--tRNA ligase [Flavobacteriales bacterium]MDC0854507.1 lysine--tRNA ligase [Flavobacteriales bacterium]
MQRSEQERVRRDSLATLRKMGIEPYPAAEFVATHRSNALAESFEDGMEVTLAGRLMNRRIMGKASFAVLQDSAGTAQLYLNRDEMCPGEDKSMYNDVFKKLLDRGDFIGVQGTTFTTKTGEQSVKVKSLTVLSKSLKPLPSVKVDEDGKVHDAFTDPELRYRMRYVDLVVNPDVKKTFEARSQIIRTIRESFDQQGWLEVDTPVLQTIPGGAAARPFITHHNALDSTLYLRIANELYLKRLIVGGFEGVFEFSRNFRNEGMDRTHNPEFTVLELYVAYKDYHWMMETTEQLLANICQAVHGGTKANLNGVDIDFAPPYQRISMRDAIRKHTGIDIDGKNEEQLRAACESVGLETDASMGKGKLIDELFGEKCEHHFVQPTFIMDYPVEMSPLTKVHRDNPAYTERFELMINGTEVANAYSELNDPDDQRQRFEDQLALSERGDDEAMFIDQDFLRALEYGMPPTSGIGIGIDRLVMMLTDQTSIQEVLLFPQMRPEVFESGPDVAGLEAMGISPSWVEHVIAAGYESPAAMEGVKPAGLREKLNGFRKKNKLDLPALSIEEVEGWFNPAN